MLFTSYHFYLFAVIVFVLFRLLPWKYGRLVILAASYYFYGTAEPWYVLLLFASTLIDFFTAQWMHKSETLFWRRFFLGLSLLGNLGMLFSFKYVDFAIENVNSLFYADGGGFRLREWILPVGISFYTFQTLSYTIDVYRKEFTPVKDFIQFAIYVSFFPQLVAGPIERASKLLPQFEKKNRVSREDYELGFQRILWGLVKKVVVADRLAIVVDQVYANPAAYSGWDTLLALACFSMQIYLDFSAYTDIAIGIARLFGVKLSENFDWPYLAENPSEVWSRWHMTLTNWFTDYVYRPLGGTKRSKPFFTFANITFTMTLIGFWHGAAWNFVFFGLVAGVTSGIFMLIKLHPAMKRRKFFGNYFWSKPLAILLTYLWFITTVGVFFRAGSLETVAQIWAGLLDFSNPLSDIFVYHALLVSGVIASHIIRGFYFYHRRPLSMSPLVRGIFWFFLVLVLLYLGIGKTGEFIYFQF